MGGKLSRMASSSRTHPIGGSGPYSSATTGSCSGPYPSYGQQQPVSAPYHGHSFDSPPPSYNSSYGYPPPPSSPPRYSRRSALPSGSASEEYRREIQRQYSRIADKYISLEEVTEALAQSGLESSNLIVGIDFTKSNDWTGKISFSRRSLHHISDVQNPYEQAISIIGSTLSPFDEDNKIPCFGFGDASTHDEDVFSFYADGRSCDGFVDALSRYRELVPNLHLSGTTSFAPIIEMATTIVQRSGGRYHILLIITDGDVTRSVDTDPGQYSPQEQKTRDAIIRASYHPLSIVVVGVGDGPWDLMKEFDDNIPERIFDNLQFVNFSEIMLKNIPQDAREAQFALSALMEIPQQYKAIKRLGHLGFSPQRYGERTPLPPPGASSSQPRIQSFTLPTAPSISEAPSAPPLGAVDGSNQLCCICLTNQKDMAFNCGHRTCCHCSSMLQNCPICRSPITNKTKLYDV